MDTKIFVQKDIGERETEELAGIIRAGGLVAIPTETVYGLGANALDPEAVKKIFKVKGRPQDNPLIIHLSSEEEIKDYCLDIPDTAYVLARRFWPGPLTMVLKKRDIVPDETSSGLSTVGVRCPDNDVTRAVIRASGVPIAAPSANLSGKPSTTEFSHIMHDLYGKVDAMIDGGSCRVGLESTILDLTSEPPRLLRPGGLTVEQLEEAIGRIAIDDVVYRQLKDGEKPRAPGMKYRHYAPDASVILVRGDSAAAAEYINAHTDEHTAVMCFEGEESMYRAPRVEVYGSLQNMETLGEHLFSALRKLDTEDIDTIYARCPGESGIGLAVNNRLTKAAGYHIVEL